MLKSNLNCYFLQWFVLFNYSVFTLDVTKIVADKDWTQYPGFGQISAVTVDNVGDVYVFHRGGRRWDFETFRSNERFSRPLDGPIDAATIVVLSPNGSVVASTGKDLFYLPHGMTVDEDYNLWVTDVALHQVIKFPPVVKSNPTAALPLALLTLGEPLVPGRGPKHFCKPTSVAVDPHSKDFFVADGYCNSRIMKFDKDGRFLIEWGQPTAAGIYSVVGPYNLKVPHSLTLNEVAGHLMVADRENSRVVCYTTNGYYVNEIRTQALVYGVSYSSVSDKLYAVTGTTLNRPGVGLVYSMSNDSLTAIFAPHGNFKNAHDVAVSHDGQHVYAVELDPFVVWRFTVEATLAEIATKVQQPESKNQDNRHDEPSRSNRKLEQPKDEELPTAQHRPDRPGFDPVATLGANQLAVSIVTAVALLGILAVSCHMYRKKGTVAHMEMRGLILSDDDDRSL